MIGVERNSSKIFRLRFDPLCNCCHSSSHRNCNGVQLKRSLYDERAQRFLLLSKETGSLVPAGNRTALDNEKLRLPQAPPVHLSDHDFYFPVIDYCDVSRVQQKSGRSSSMVDVRRFFLPTFRAGKVYSGLIHRKVPGETCRQVKKFRVRLFTKSNCSWFLFHTHPISARFWHRHDNFRGHLHHAIYRRAQEKISIPFNSSNSSVYSLGYFNCRIQNSKNHSLSQSVGRSFRNWVPGYSILLRFWKGWILGNRFRGKLPETFPSSRSAYRFYFFSDRGRVGVCRNYGNRPLVLNFHMERIYDCLPSQRPFWNPFGNGVDSLNRFTGFYKPWSCFRSSPYKGVDLTFYKHGRLVDAGDDAFCRSNTKYFRASSKTLMMN